MHAHDDIWVEPLHIFAADETDMDQLERIICLHLIVLRGKHGANFLILLVIGLKENCITRVTHFLGEFGGPDRRFVFDLIEETASLLSYLRIWLLRFYSRRLATTK